MLLFVSGEWWRRRQRPPRPDDDVPMAPVFDFFAFWALISLGSFAVATAGFIAYAVMRLGIAGEWRVLAGIVLLTAVGIVAIERAFVFWWRLR